jgi:hypothetical protein
MTTTNDWRTLSMMKGNRLFIYPFNAIQILRIGVGDGYNAANFIVEHEFGPNHENGTGLGLALQSKYRLDKMFEPGIEYYADFGNIDQNSSFNEQDHKIRPVVEGRFNNISYNTGVLFGISDPSQDTTIKLNLEYEF